MKKCLNLKRRFHIDGKPDADTRQERVDFGYQGDPRRADSIIDDKHRRLVVVQRGSHVRQL